jgi:hypothetical protein
MTSVTVASDAKATAHWAMAAGTYQCPLKPTKPLRPLVRLRRGLRPEHVPAELAVRVVKGRALVVHGLKGRWFSRLDTDDERAARRLNRVEPLSPALLDLDCCDAPRGHSLGNSDNTSFADQAALAQPQNWIAVPSFLWSVEGIVYPATAAPARWLLPCTIRRPLGDCAVRVVVAVSPEANEQHGTVALASPKRDWKRLARLEAVRQGGKALCQHLDGLLADVVGHDIILPRSNRPP